MTRRSLEEFSVFREASINPINPIIISLLDKPTFWNVSVFFIIRTLSETVVLPIARLVVTYVPCTELFGMVIGENSMHEVDLGSLHTNARSHGKRAGSSTRLGFENVKEKPCFGIAAYPISFRACLWQVFIAVAVHLPRSILNTFQIERRKGA
jgi:hypothetical protein